MAEAEAERMVAVVSGGGTGIGRATTRALAAGGVEVLIVGRRAEVLETTAREIEAEIVGSSVNWMQADAADPEAVDSVVDHLTATYDLVDAVVNCAGGAADAGGEGLAGVAGSWRRTFDQNVLSAVLLTYGIAPILRRPGGRIVLVSSMASRTGGGGAPYVAAKGALNAWVLSLAAHFGPQGITANVVAPGYTPDTEMSASGVPSELHERIVSRTAMGRAGRSEDVAGVIRFLVSPDAAFVTGQVIEVAGGALPPSV